MASLCMSTSWQQLLMHMQGSHNYSTSSMSGNALFQCCDRTVIVVHVWHVEVNLLLTQRPVRNKMARQTSSTAVPCSDLQLNQRFLLSSTSSATTISFASSNNDSRVLLAIDFGVKLFFHPYNECSVWLNVMRQQSIERRNWEGH